MTKAELLLALDNEVSHLRDEYALPGWNYWALVGGVGSLIWLGLKIYGGQPSVNSEAVFAFFVGLALLEDTFRDVAQSLSESSKAPTDIRFQHLDVLAEGTNPLLFLVSTRNILLLVLVWLAAPAPGPLVQIFATLTFIFRILIWGSVTYLFRLQIALPTTTQDQGLNAVSVIQHAFQLGTTIAYLHFLHPHMLPLLPDFQLACILFAIYYIAYSHFAQLPLLSRISALLEIRRGVAFEVLPLEAAISRSRNIIVGPEPIQIFQREILPVAENLIAVAGRFEIFIGLIQPILSAYEAKDELELQRLTMALQSIPPKPHVIDRSDTMIILSIAQALVLPADAHIDGMNIGDLQAKMWTAIKIYRACSVKLVRIGLTNLPTAIKLWRELPSPATGNLPKNLT